MSWAFHRLSLTKYKTKLTSQWLKLLLEQWSSLFRGRQQNPVPCAMSTMELKLLWYVKTEENVTHSQENRVKTEIKPNMAQMFDLADKCIKVAIINTFKDLKENTFKQVKTNMILWSSQKEQLYKWNISSW